MAISDEDFQRAMELKRATMLANQEKRRSALEQAAKPHASELHRREMDRKAFEAQLRQIRQQVVEPIDLDNLT